ncbi:MAG TPA: zf-HC2 domain-containing protein [Acidimicrobiales bacterium]|jgi:predicted anti-sigma-YlaC factor YlaD|nr:zf-HC2 domain-containing protein [Acidimicrobiales bacterium]
MSRHACEQWHGAIALDALGAIEPDERLGLLAHLDGCAACREAARELAQTASVLAFVDRDELGQTASVPPELAERVLGSLHDDALAARRHRRTRQAGVFTAVGAVAASIAILLAIGSPAHAGGRKEILSSPTTAATATAVLTTRPWGTAIAFTEEGLPAGHVYNVAMRTASGKWWTAGSYRTVAGHPVSAQMSCYVQLDRITGIRVTDTTGASVLWNVAARGTTW